MKIKYIFTLKDGTAKEISIEIEKEQFLQSKEIFNITTNRFTSNVLYSTTDINNKIALEFEELIEQLDEYFPVLIVDEENNIVIADLSKATMNITISMDTNGQMVKRVSLIAYKQEKEHGSND
jgi:maltodextrin utilization protein YvdJ